MGPMSKGALASERCTGRHASTVGASDVRFATRTKALAVDVSVLAIGASVLAVCGAPEHAPAAIDNPMAILIDCKSLMSMHYPADERRSSELGPWFLSTFAPHGRPSCASTTPPILGATIDLDNVIRLDGVSKQHGHQILFLEASCAIFRGEKVGLVGPNGSGKSTIFRMIVREEEPDSGQVAVDRGTTIGHFSQDIGEMSGMSVVASVLDGAGPVSTAPTRPLRVRTTRPATAAAGSMGEPVLAFGQLP